MIRGAKRVVDMKENKWALTLKDNRLGRREKFLTQWGLWDNRGVDIRGTGEP